MPSASAGSGRFFYNNLSFLLWSQGAKKLATQENHQALDGLEELLTPAPQLEKQLAVALMLHLATGPSAHPEFHVLYKHLGDEYVKLATGYLNSGSVNAAALTIDVPGKYLAEGGRAGADEAWKFLSGFEKGIAGEEEPASVSECS